MKYYITTWIVREDTVIPLKLEIIPEASKIQKVCCAEQYKQNYDYLREQGNSLLKTHLRHMDCTYQVTLWNAGQIGNLLPMEPPVH